MRRDLSAIDRDIGQDWSRIIQEAFKHGIDCDIIHGGLLAGRDEQGIYEASLIQNYILGTRRTTPDGRVFRYGKCGADIPGMKWGVSGHNLLVTEKGIIVSAAAKGATSLTVTFDSDFWDTKLEADELYGGYISLYNSSTVRDQRMIISNTAVKASGGECTIGILGGLSVAFTSVVECEVLANPYSDVRIAGSDKSVLGMPCVLATTGQYFWMQTWGICRITPTGAELGTVYGERMFVFGTNGAICSLKVWHDTGLGLNHSYQIAGFLVERTVESEGSAAPFIMLQISP